MQALTLAIGPAGIAFFATKLVADKLASALGGISLPDRTINVPGWTSFPSGGTDTYSKIVIKLTDGQLHDFTPGFQGVTQAASGQFVLVMVAGPFSAQYSWNESWHEQSCAGGAGCSDDDFKAHFKYKPQLKDLTATVTTGFQWNNATASYDINVISSGATAHKRHANIPAHSVIESEETDCFSSHVSDETTNAVETIDFGARVSSVITPLLSSIPASGNLTADIKYTFGLGDSGLTFPDNAGIAIGVTGAVTYKGEAYPGTPPAHLPVPPPPAASDTHHLQLYVSNYEIDALHWAFFKAGALSLEIEPDDLTDPDVLKCKTYANVKGFEHYRTFGMTAHIVPLEAPAVTFAKVWELTDSVEQALKSQLPADVYALIDDEGLQGNVYTSQAAFESDMSDAGIDKQYWPTIEKAAESMGLVLKQDLEFTLTIDNHETTLPNLVFDLSRVDVLEALKLGTHGSAQTLLFDCNTAESETVATFKSTTIPGFEDKEFGGMIWPVAGEPNYRKALKAIGAAGAPLPIMSDFAFRFDQAEISIQDGYVSILAEVVLKGS